jgi:hypothetical protein
MPNINLYATLAEYKTYRVARGQSATTDTTDDGVIVDLLEKASRDLDDMTGRQFYPSIETDAYDIPNSSELLFSKDVLAVISLTNGDDTAIASTEYNLLPSGFTPYYGLKLKGSTSVQWEADDDGNTEQVLELVAWCGFRRKFAQRGWLLAGTLGAAITDTTTLAFTMTAGHTITAGQIVKIDSEIYNVSTVVSNTVTPITRGDNGSTAVTHLNGASVYVWKPQEEARGVVLELANAAYQRRFGKVIGESATVTAAGVVLSPKDMSDESKGFIASVQRLV